MSDNKDYLVTGMKKISAMKTCVEVNYDTRFSLYNSEVFKFHIEQGEYITSDSYNTIFNEILPKRARERCLNLLTKKSMTEYELTKKLREGFYPEEIISRTMEVMFKHHLVNDDDYARSFVELSHNAKSKRRLKQDMIRKGISQDIIVSALEESDINEEDNINRLMVKKHIDPESSTYEEKQKFAAFLLRKGYDYDLINKIVFK